MISDDWGIYTPSSMGHSSPCDVFMVAGSIAAMATLDRDRLRAAITEAGLTARALSRSVGDNPYLVRDILSGKSQNPRSDTVSKLANALSVTPASLMSDADGSTSTSVDLRLVPKFLPVRYRVQAGNWLEVDAYTQEFIGPDNPVAPDPRYADWAQWLEQVVGDSINLKIPEGGFAHVVDAIDMGYSARTGDYVVVERRKDGGHSRERTIKQVVVNGRGIELWPRSTNPKWKEAVRPTDGTNGEIEVEIVGLVIGAYVGF